MSPQYPIFICPNCRAGADLEADVDETSEEWQLMSENEQKAAEAATTPPATEAAAPEAPAEEPAAEVGDVTMAVGADSPAVNGDSSTSAISQPVPIRNPASGAGRGVRNRGTPSPPGGREGPITPRNDAGPWVFDGTAGRRVAEANAEMRSIDATAADGDVTMNDSDVPEGAA